MKLNDTVAPGSLVTWLIVLILLVNTLLLIGGGIIYFQLQQRVLKQECSFRSSLELDREYRELHPSLVPDKIDRNL
ncbi:MAG: hypothetical protein V1738_03405 [Patescibacteria group bacterium]